MDAVEKELQGYTKKNGAATSNLSAMDFWLIVDARYEPLGFVLGNSVMSMGISGGFATAFKGFGSGSNGYCGQADRREIISTSDSTSRELTLE
jgi:hypothetical protein